jgi:hypothetical protein
MGGEKLCLGGGGQVTYQARIPSVPLRELTFYMEAGAKRVLAKDHPDCGRRDPFVDFVRTGSVDPGSFTNSYFMTDDTPQTSRVEMLVDGEPVATLPLGNDYADARGVLSWHTQPDIRKLDEAGSWGEEKRIPIPSRLINAIVRNGGFTLTLRAADGGLALYGRHAGRYAHGLLLRIR